MGQLFENELMVGDEVAYKGLDTTRIGTIIKRSKRRITIQFLFFHVHLAFVPNVPASDLGLRRVLQLVK